MTARDRMMILVVAVLAAIAGSWLLVIQPKRDQAASLENQVKSVQTELDSARADLAAGEAARAAFGGSYTALVRLGEAVPADDNVPSLIFQIQGAATNAHVDFRTLVLSSASGGSSVITAPVTSLSATQSATVSLPPGATVGAAGFPIEPFTFTFQGNFFHLADFLGRIEKFVVASNKDHFAVSGRLMTLNAISLSPGPAGFPQITATVAADTYLVPADQGILNGATAAGPAGSSGTVTASTQTSTSAVPAAAVATTGLR